MAHGHHVIAVDNFITGSPANIAHLKREPRFEFLYQDVTTFLEVEGPVDAILHFASPASPKSYIEYPIQTLKVGSLGTHNTLGLARIKGACFLLASTSEVYGDPLVHPQREDYWGNVNPTGPRGVYDESKRFSEAMTLAYHRTHHLDTRIVRIFNTYGPRMALDDGRVVPNFVGQALRGEPLTVHGDGSQTRAFTYVTDLVDGIARLLDSDEHMPVNIGNPNELTIRTFAEKINAATGNRAGIIYTERPVDDPGRCCPDITKAQKLLDWAPKVQLDEGLAETITFFRKQMQLG